MVDRLGLELSTKLIKEIKYATAVLSMPIVEATPTSIIPSEVLLPSQLVGLYVEVIDGNGKGQIRKITSNTDTSITVAPAFSTVPEPFSIITIHSIPSQTSELDVYNKTIPLGATYYVASGEAVAFLNLTVEGRLIIKGEVDVYGTLAIIGTIDIIGTLEVN